MYELSYRKLAYGSLKSKQLLTFLIFAIALEITRIIIRLQNNMMHNVLMMQNVLMIMPMYFTLVVIYRLFEFLRIICPSEFTKLYCSLMQIFEMATGAINLHHI